MSDNLLLQKRSKSRPDEPFRIVSDTLKNGASILKTKLNENPILFLAHWSIARTQDENEMSRPYSTSPEVIRLTAKLVRFQLQLQQLLREDQTDPDINIRTRIARLRVRDTKIQLYLLT